MTYYIGNIPCSNELYHFGKGHDDNPPGRGSGRYAWGTGNGDGAKQKKTSAIKTALTSDKAKNIYKTTGKIATTAAISGIITIGAANIYGLQAKTLYAMGTSALSGIIGQIESKLLNKDVINENDISESVLRENIVGEEYIRENVLRENVIEENMLRENVIEENMLRSRVTK